MYRVNFLVVGDGLQRDVWHTFVDEALLYVARSRVVLDCLPGQLGLFLDAVGRIG